MRPILLLLPLRSSGMSHTPVAQVIGMLVFALSPTIGTALGDRGKEHTWAIVFTMASMW